ncbi:VgrG-related protein [Streptomyces sp. WZ-12]|uniref:VgrG-related protein n=1 Tax=Streptomyces sp. WZ-12 TaxID=3030210 RepID=UPI0023810228|nr:VgrG-related protein [Streptomyces sp. WZ-12]
MANLPQIIFNSKQLSGCFFESLSVDTHTRLPASARLSFRDPYHEMLSKFEISIGSTVEISVPIGSSRQELFDGEVTAVETEFNTDGTFTVIRALDRAHRLHHGRHAIVYEGMTTKEILGEVVRRVKLKLGKVDRDEEQGYMAQTNMTDWEFLQMLTRKTGLELVVDREELSLLRPAAADKAPHLNQITAKNPYVLKFGDNLLTLRIMADSAGQAEEVKVIGWDPLIKDTVTTTAKAGKSPQIDLGLTPGEAAKKLGLDTPPTELATGCTSAKDAKATAEALATSITSGFIELEASLRISPQLRAGTPVTLINTGSIFTGRYTATSVTHVFDQNGDTTWVRLGARTAPPAPLPYERPPLPPGYHAGLAVAKVVAVKSDKNTPDHVKDRGQVKLKLPWLSETYETDWVRTVQLGGVRGGGVISPEVGDEVLIGFEQGRLDHPYVLGGLYNGKDKPTPSSEDLPLIDPESKDHINRQSLASRSGDRLEFLDAKDKDPQGIRLSTGEGRQVLQLDRFTKTTSITGDQHVCLTTGDGQRTLHLSQEDGNIDIANGDSSISITDNGAIILNGEGFSLDAGSADLTLKTTGNVKIEGRSVEIN